MTNLVEFNFKDLDEVATDADSLYFLLSLASFIKPKVVVEAGTWKGHFSLTLVTLMPDIIVCTADPIRFMKDSGPLQYYQGDFVDMLEVYKLDSINFAYIDSGPPCSSDWDNGIRWRHYEAVLPRMAPGGLIVSHDMNDRDWEGADKIYELASIYLPAGRGLTIQQV